MAGTGEQVTSTGRAESLNRITQPELAMYVTSQVYGVKKVQSLPVEPQDVHLRQDKQRLLLWLATNRQVQLD